MTPHAAERDMDEPRWIPVTESLPADDVRVLANDGLHTFTAERFEGLWHWIEGDTFGVEVTHWKPLPGTPVRS